MSTRNLARTAGALYLVLAAAGGFSQLYVRSNVSVPGDARVARLHASASACPHQEDVRVRGIDGDLAGEGFLKVADRCKGPTAIMAYS